jgi:hypothetical protein
MMTHTSNSPDRAKGGWYMKSKRTGVSGRRIGVMREWNISMTCFVR